MFICDLSFTKILHILFCEYVSLQYSIKTKSDFKATGIVRVGGGLGVIVMRLKVQ